MKHVALTMILGLLSVAANASVVAIVDSGTDYLHKDLMSNMWTNPVEIQGNNRDEDLNGYVDDYYGWNFAESNNKVIDYKYLGTLNYDIRKFFEIQTRMLKGMASPADLQWVQDKRTEEEFIKSLQVYGNFMHGTHVSGIAAKGNVNANILAIKLIPTEVAVPGQFVKPKAKNAFRMWLFKQALGFIAEQQTTMMVEISRYLNSHKSHVMNGSFGTGFDQAKMIIAQLAPAVLGREPSEAEMNELASHLIDNMVVGAKKMIQEAEDTLFVWAAGNSGLNNDKFPSSPTNVRGSNTISVAATIGTAELASFSNYGEEMVEVAAPGVGISSTVPGSQYLEVSGTSQAAPYVTNVAARIKDQNEDLLPRQMKDIIMKTVDVKSWLSGKVATSGIVNMARAERAAELSLTMRLKDAIAEANRTVKDMPTIKSLHKGGNAWVLPLASQFVIK